MPAVATANSDVGAVLATKKISSDDSDSLEQPERLVSAYKRQCMDRFDPGVLFDLLDVSADGFLNEEEFYAMFAQLDVNVSEGKKEEMFAYSDSHNADRTISRDEFVDAWNWLEDQMLEGISIGLGLSKMQIYSMLFVLAVQMIAIFAFLAVAIAAFQTNGNFVAVVQASLSAASGMAAGVLQKKPKAEELKEASPEELKKYIHSELRDEDK